MRPQRRSLAVRSTCSCAPRSTASCCRSRSRCRTGIFPVEIPTITGAIFLLATILQPSMSYRRIPGAALWFFTYLWMFGFSTLINRSAHGILVFQLFLLMLQLVLILWTAYNLLRDRTVLRGVLITLAFAAAGRAALQVLGIGATAQEVWTGGERVTAFARTPI